MKVKSTLPLSTFVLSFFLATSANATSPSASWRDTTLTSTITVDTMDPDTSVAGGAIGGFVSGDFNCDGYDDLVAATGASRYGKVFIHLGSASYSFPSDLTDSDYVITGTITRQYLGLKMETISDIDGDSCPELVLAGDKKNDTGKTAFYLYKSSTISGWDDDATDDDDYTDDNADSYIETNASASDLYFYVKNVGKINGASNGEYLAICSSSKFTCYFMPVSALEAGSGTVESNSIFYIYSADSYDSVAGGDVDGDGEDDLVIGSPGNARDNLAIIFGPVSDSTATFSSGYYTTSSAPADDNIIIWNTGSVNSFGTGVQMIDIDNDGKKEVLFSYPSELGTTGYYYLVTGFENLKGVTNEVYGDKSTGTYNFASGELDVAIYYGEVGAYLGYDNNAAVGDFNGDGYEDLYLGGQNYITGTVKGRGYILYNHTVSEGMPSAPNTFEDDFGDEVELTASNRADAYIDGANDRDQFSETVLTGDFDGDGDDALVIYAPGPNSGYGQLAIIELPDDVDADGIEAKDGDCNDTDDTLTGPTTWYADADSDGKGDTNTTQSACAQPTGYVLDNTDCDDTDATVTTRLWYWDSDEDSYGNDSKTTDSCWPVSATGSGEWVSVGGDCNDSNATLNPDTVWYADSDGDGFGDSADTTTSCTNPSSTSKTYVLKGEDCDDANSDLTPYTNWYKDNDGDSYGNITVVTQVCEQPTGYVRDKADCDDTDATINPKTVWYGDSDRDGYGSSTVTRMSCTQPSGYVSNSTDCNDASATINPDTVWYADADSDTYGDAATTTASCVQPTGYVANSSDCNDTNSSINPNTVWYLDSDGDTCGDSASTIVACEQPSGYVATATDCDDGDATLNDTTVWYADNDGDGYGDASATSVSCGQPTGYVSNSTDCNDSDSALNPTTVWYADADGDGYGDAATTTISCEQPSGYLADSSDCDDTDATINPESVWYADTDGDGLGDAATSTLGCEAPAGYVADASDDDLDGDSYSVADGDCDDAEASVYPGASESTAGLGDAIDNNCDGRVDENLMTVTLDTSTLPSGTVSAGSSFNLDVNIVNNTGLTDFTVVALVPNSPAGAAGGGGLAKIGAGIVNSFCPTPTSCTELGETVFTLSSGDSDTITIPAVVDSSLTAGRYAVRILVINSAGEVQARASVTASPGVMLAKNSIRIR